MWKHHRIWIDVTAQKWKVKPLETSTAWMFVSPLFDLRQPFDSPACLYPMAQTSLCSLSVSTSGASLWHLRASIKVDVSVINCVVNHLLSCGKISITGINAIKLFPEMFPTLKWTLRTLLTSKCLENNLFKNSIFTVFTTHSHLSRLRAEPLLFMSLLYRSAIS